MTGSRITSDLSASFARHLRQAERSPGTTENHPRHLFARVFYRVCRDAAKPADVLGHVCMDTARIYLAASGAGHARTLDRLRLVLQDKTSFTFCPVLRACQERAAFEDAAERENGANLKLGAKSRARPGFPAVSPYCDAKKFAHRWKKCLTTLMGLNKINLIICIKSRLLVWVIECNDVVYLFGRFYTMERVAQPVY